MEIQPVPQIEAPAYPTRDELLADKQTLQDCLPCRWRKTRGLAGALALFLAANAAGCGGGANGRPGESAVVARDDSDAQPGESPAIEEDDSDTLVVEADYWIRSIFQKRYVMMGCVALMPPAVLQEDAAVHAAQDSGQ